MSGITLQLVLLVLAGGLLAFGRAAHIRMWLRTRLASSGLVSGPFVTHPNQDAAPGSVDTSIVPGTHEAMREPPSLARTLAQLDEIVGAAPAHFPLGWCITDGRPNIAYAAFIREVNHMLITGKSDSGKDNMALNILYGLCVRQPPSQVQVCIVDGKGLDFVQWQQKAHTWRLALDPHDIAPAMEALTAERERRGRVLRAAQATKWDEYVGDDLPLLVCYISELSLLQDVVGKAALESWMNSELAAGRAFGMRYIIATQTASNFGTRWRSQVDLFLAGFQPLDSQDEPNTGLTTRKIKDLGSVPPSELPEAQRYPGVFVAVQGRTIVVLRSTYLAPQERQRWLSMLPDVSTLSLPRMVGGLPTATPAPVRREPVPIHPEMSQAPVFDEEIGTSSRTQDVVPADTRAVPGGSQPNDDVLIRELVLRQMSGNKIADIIGGRRTDVLEKVRRVRETLDKERLHDVAQTH